MVRQSWLSLLVKEEGQRWWKGTNRILILRCPEHFEKKCSWFVCGEDGVMLEKLDCDV